ncbi:CUE domain protein [Aspergillus flavus]|nr:CUE domain protein [Aspergillus flavus]RAQ63255.1 CUE domain protein [Aspergillus flavus]
MAEEDKSNTNKITSGPYSPKPESPTTARPLDFDDEPQESGITSVSAAVAQQHATDVAPQKPPRPLSPQQQSETTLKEAFPTIEVSVIKAVLVASNWDVERAFHALLGMTDPSAAEQDVPPPKPPRPSATQRQLEADELYARQLAEHYNRRGPQSRLEGGHPYDRPRRDSELLEDREYSFFEDDLPVIRENIRKGFLETQTKVNSWVQNLKKRLDGEDQDSAPSSQRYRNESDAQTRRSGELGRRSGDRERYDADPQVLSDDFSALEMRDTEAPPPRPPRPLANPNLYKASSPSPDRRKVSFQEGPPTEIGGSLDDGSEPSRHSPAGGKPSKWQPLSTVEPSPVGDHDPFSLGDSEDEKDTRPKDQTPADGGDRIKTATAEAIAGELPSASKANQKADGEKS